MVNHGIALFTHNITREKLVFCRFKNYSCNFCNVYWSDSPLGCMFSTWLFCNSGQFSGFLEQSDQLFIVGSKLNFGRRKIFFNLTEKCPVYFKNFFSYSLQVILYYASSIIFIFDGSVVVFVSSMQLSIVSGTIAPSSSVFIWYFRSPFLSFCSSDSLFPLSSFCSSHYHRFLVL